MVPRLTRKVVCPLRLQRAFHQLLCLTGLALPQRTNPTSARCRDVLALRQQVSSNAPASSKRCLRNELKPRESGLNQFVRVVLNQKPSTEPPQRLRRAMPRGIAIRSHLTAFAGEKNFHGEQATGGAVFFCSFSTLEHSSVSRKADIVPCLMTAFPRRYRRHGQLRVVIEQLQQVTEIFRAAANILLRVKTVLDTVARAVSGMSCMSPTAPYSKQRAGYSQTPQKLRVQQRRIDLISACGFCHEWCKTVFFSLTDLTTVARRSGPASSRATQRQSYRFYCHGHCCSGRSRRHRCRCKYPLSTQGKKRTAISSTIKFYLHSKTSA